MSNATPVEQKAYWVVVADEAKAIFYSQETKRSPLRELCSLQNEAAQKKTGDLISDRGGRSFDSHGQGRHTMAREKTDPQKHYAIAFAKQIAARIVTAKQNGSCREFALIAAPRFLGILREALPMTGNFAPLRTIDKEVVGQNTAVIQKLLDEKIRH